MSATSTLTALAAVLPTGTNIQETSIETTLDQLGGAWPCLVLFVTKTTETRVGSGRKREAHQVVAIYLDRFDSSARTAAQIIADARTTIEALKANLRSNYTLTVATVRNALDANRTIETTVHGIVEDVAGQALPFPMLAAEIGVEVWDLDFTG